MTPPVRSLAVMLAAFGAVLSPAATGAAERAGAPCSALVDRGVLPVWARDGFSEARPRMAHTVGRSGAIAALIFGYPLQAPPAKGRSNKILWVSRRDTVSMSDLRISAQRMRGSERIGKPVARKVAGGPGPSTIDLPGTGCWRLTLTWSGRTDTLDLRYVHTERS